MRALVQVCVALEVVADNLHAMVFVVNHPIWLVLVMCVFIKNRLIHCASPRKWLFLHGFVFG